MSASELEPETFRPRFHSSSVKEYADCSTYVRRKQRPEFRRSDDTLSGELRKRPSVPTRSQTAGVPGFSAHIATALKETGHWPLDCLEDIFYMPDEDHAWNLQDMLLAVCHLCRTLRSTGLSLSTISI